MIIFLMFIGIILSIIKANGWIVIPTFAIVFCWVTSFVSWQIYCLGKSIADKANKKMADELARLKNGGDTNGGDTNA